jgi:hypothetical protein
MIDIKKYLPVGLATMAILGAITLVTSADELTPGTTSTPSTTTSAPTTPGPETGHGHRGHAINQAAETAMTNGDYNAWVAAVSQNGQLPDFLKVITKDNFAQFASMRQLMKDGKPDEAKKIADTLGLKMGMGKGGPGGFKANPAAETAISNSDYNAWITAVSVNGQVPDLLKVITQDNFPKFVEAHNDQKQAMDLMQKSRDLIKEIGFKQGPGFGGGMGHRGGKGGFRGQAAGSQTGNTATTQATQAK